MRPYYQKISYRILKLLFETIEVKLPNRTVIVPCKDLSSLTSLYWEPTWKTELVGRLCAAHPGVVLDVGANVGQTLFDALVAAPDRKYIGFEPNLRCVSYLQRLIHLNGLPDVTIIPVALGSAPALAELYSSVGSETDSGASIGRSIRPNRKVNSEYVPCLRFDDILPALRLDRVALCKIDVEGFEFEVLDGMRSFLKAGRPPILCEILDSDEGADIELHGHRIGLLEALLEEVGYRIFRIIKGQSLQFSRLEPIERLPRKRWAKVDEEQCDYLLAHRSESPLTT